MVFRTPAGNEFWGLATVYLFEVSCGLGAASGVRGPVSDGVYTLIPAGVAINL